MAVSWIVAEATGLRPLRQVFLSLVSCGHETRGKREVDFSASGLTLPVEGGKWPALSGVGGLGPLHTSSSSVSAQTQSEHAGSVNDLVDAVYVLSVQSFTDRIAYIEDEMGKHGIRFRFMFEHDAAQLDEASLSTTFGPSDMKRSHQSLVLKNIEVWREAVAHGYRRVLVFEDDAVLKRDFDERFREAMGAADALAPGWSIFLGGLDTKVPTRYFLEPGPLVELPMATAEGCVYDLLAMQRRLDWLARHRVTLPADHLMRHVDLAQGTRQFWLRHPVVEQGSVLGVFASHLDGVRQKHGRFYNIFRNRWNKFQRRVLREWLTRMKLRF